MSSTTTDNERLARVYFECIEELKDDEGNSTGSKWQCRECPLGKGVVKRHKAGGWTPLATHARKHDGWQEKMAVVVGVGPMDGHISRKVSAEAWNAYHWIDWVVMGDHPFSFVENVLTNKYTSLSPISRPSLMKYLHALDLEVSEIIKSTIPATFGLVVDGWTCAREHYFASFAVWTNNVGHPQRVLLCCGVQDEDEDSTMDFTAESLGDYLYDELQLMGRDFSALEFIAGDNTATNPKIARLITNLVGHPVPLIGCASHKLNLAVELFIDDGYKDVVEKIAVVCAKLRQLKNASKLRKKGLPCALLRSIKWGSTKDMTGRYLEIHDALGGCDFDADVLRSVLSFADLALAKDLYKALTVFDKVSKLLQMDGLGEKNIQALTLDAVRNQFDKLIEKYPTTARHLSANADIIQNKTFEKGIVKLQAGKERELTPGERHEIRGYLKDAAAAEDIESEDSDEDDDAVKMHLEYERLKEVKNVQGMSKYRSTKHIACTTNMVERLFSRARIVMTDLRRSMTPRHLEMLMFLRLNRHLWNEIVVQRAMIRPA